MPGVVNGRKYAGREHVLEVRVPPLDCLWNDVLHLSPVHPADIVAELRKVGLEPLRTRFFEIDPPDLDRSRTVVFINSRANLADPLDQSQSMPFDHALDDLTRFNEPSRRYYGDCAADGVRPLLWGYLPHVFYRGSLQTHGRPIVDV